MLGNVEKYLLTPIVLRVARKYIKDAEGAAASDLRVSISGGSVVFRNFELNLEEIVKNLPCSVVRTFARELHVKIPWTRLATEPIEIILDTVECVFKDGTPGAGASGENSDTARNDTGGNEASTVAGEEVGFAGMDPCTGTNVGRTGVSDRDIVGAGWITSLLKQTVANVTVRVNNLVCKYIMPGAVMSISCDSAVIYSVDDEWNKGFFDFEDGVRKVGEITNIAVCLDELSADGKVNKYHDSLLRTASSTIRLSFLPAMDNHKQRGTFDIRVQPVEVSLSDLQIRYLKQLATSFAATSHSSSTETKKGEKDSQPANGFKVQKDKMAEDAAVLDGEGRTSESVRVGGGVSAVSSRALGWAWKFFADEESPNNTLSADQLRQAALEELEAGVAGFSFDAGMEMLIQAKLHGGAVKFFLERLSPQAGGAEEEKPVEIETVTLLSARSSGNVLSLNTTLESQEPQLQEIFIPTPALFDSLPKEPGPARIQSLESESLFTLEWSDLELDAHINAEGLQSGAFRLMRLSLMRDRSGDVRDTILSIYPRSSEPDGPLEPVPGYMAHQQVDSTDSGSAHEFGRNSEGHQVLFEEVLGKHGGAIQVGWWREKRLQEVWDKDGVVKGRQNVKNVLSLGAPVYNMVDKKNLICSIGNVVLGLRPQFLSKVQALFGLPSVRSGVDTKDNTHSGDTGTSEASNIVFQGVSELFDLHKFQVGVESCRVAALSTKSDKQVSAVVMDTNSLKISLEPISQEEAILKRPTGPALRCSFMVQLSVSDNWHFNKWQGTMRPIMKPCTVKICLDKEMNLDVISGNATQLRGDFVLDKVSLVMDEADCNSVLTVIDSNLSQHQEANSSLKLPGYETRSGYLLQLQVLILSAGVTVKPDMTVNSASLTIDFCTVDVLGFRLDCSAFAKIERGFSLQYQDSSPHVFIPEEPLRLCNLEIGLVKVFVMTSSLFDIADLYSECLQPALSCMSFRNSSTSSIDQTAGALPLSNVAKIEITLVLDSNIGPVVDSSVVTPVHGKAACKLTFESLQISASTLRKLNSSDFGDRVETGLIDEGPLASEFNLTLGTILLVLGILLSSSDEEEQLHIVDGALLHSTNVHVSNKKHCVVQSKNSAAEVMEATVEGIALCVTRSQHILLLRFSRETLSFLDSVMHAMLSDSSRSQIVSPMSFGCEGFSPLQESQPHSQQLIICLQQAKVELGMWRDDLDYDMETCTEVLKASSYLSAQFQAISFNMLRRVDEPNVSNLKSFSTDITSGEAELSIEQFVVLTRRQKLEMEGKSERETSGSKLYSDKASIRCNEKGIVGVPSSSNFPEPTSSSTFHIARPMLQGDDLSGGKLGKCLIKATWAFQGEEVVKTQIEVGPIEWRIDAQLIEEIVTVAWERRKGLPKVPGLDVLPATVNARILTPLLRLHLLQSFEAFERGVGDDAVALILTAEHSIGILHDNLEADARQWTGVHNGECPGVMDMHSLAVQSFDFSVVGWEATLVGPKFAVPACLHPHSDLHVAGRLLGCPGPIIIEVDTRHLPVHISPFLVKPLKSVLMSSAEAWGNTWPVRRQCAGPVCPGDDLRSGAFSKARILEQRVLQGRISWGDTPVHDEASAQRRQEGGWIVWRYPFKRAVFEVYAQGNLFRRLVPSSHPIFFRLCFWDDESDNWMDVVDPEATLLNQPAISIKPQVLVEAEEWRLSWLVELKEAETVMPESNLLIRAAEVLRFVQVNPQGQPGKAPAGPCDGLMPFIQAKISADELRVSFLEGVDAGDGLEAAVAIVGEDVLIGCHMWTPSIWLTSAKGIYCIEFMDTSSYTYETLVEPFHLESGMSCRSSLSSSLMAASSEEQVPFDFDPVALQPAPRFEGLAVRANIPQEVTVRLLESGLQETRRLVDRLIVDGSSPALNRVDTQAPMARKRVWPTRDEQQTGYEIENACPFPLAFGQTGVKELIVVPGCGFYSYSWRAPPTLLPGATKQIQICVPSFGLAAAEDIPSDGVIQPPWPEQLWCESFSVDHNYVLRRGLHVNSSQKLTVAIQIHQGSSAKWHVVVRPAYRLLNRTATKLLVQFRGFIPTPTSVSESLAGLHNQEAFQTAIKAGNDGIMLLAASLSDDDVVGNRGHDLLLVSKTQDSEVSEPGVEGNRQVRVLVDGRDSWSTWANIKDPSSIDEAFEANCLLSTGGCFEWPNCEVEMQSKRPCLWLQVLGPKEENGGQIILTVWPLFFFYNGLSLPLDVKLERGDGSSSTVEIDIEQERALDVVSSGVDRIACRSHSGLNLSPASYSGVHSVGSGKEMKKNTHAAESDARDLKTEMEKTGIWSAFFMLTAWRTEGESSGELGRELEIPAVGHHRTLQLVSINQHNSRVLSCALVSRVYDDGVPSVLLSLLPIAVLHNFLPVEVAVAADVLRGDASMSAAALPGEKVPFAWHGTDGRRNPTRRARIGVRFGLEAAVGSNSLQNTAAQVPGPPPGTMGSKLNGGGWAWSAPLTADVEGITEVAILAVSEDGPMECRFLVRISIVRLGDAEDNGHGPAYQCCHLSVYPQMIVSNLTGWDLCLSVGDTPSGPTTSSPKPGQVALMPCEDGARLAPLIAFPRAQGRNSLPQPRQRSSVGNTTDFSFKYLVRFARTRCQGDNVGPVVDSGWSSPLDLSKFCLSQRILIPDGPGVTHDFLLTCSVLISNQQVHLLLFHDKQPPSIVINNTEFPLEVCSAIGEGLVGIVGPHGRLDYNWCSGKDPSEEDISGTAPNASVGSEWFRRDASTGLGGGYEEIMDDALLQHMKREEDTVYFLFRPGGHDWSDPIKLVAADYRVIHCEPVEENGNMLSLNVKIFQQGPTFFLQVEPVLQTRSDGLEIQTSTASTPADGWKMTMNFAVSKLRLSIWDVERHNARAQESQWKEDDINEDLTTEVAVISIEGLCFHVFRKVDVPPLPLPSVISFGSTISAELIQVDSLLENAEFPVILTSDFSAQLDPSVGKSSRAETGKGLLGSSAFRISLGGCMQETDLADSLVWIKYVSVELCPLLLNVDDCLLSAIQRVQDVFRRMSPGATEGKRRQLLHRIHLSDSVKPAGTAPNRQADLALAQPRLFIEKLEAGAINLIVTVHVSRPWVLDVNRSTVSLPSLKLKDALFPSMVLFRGLLAHYVTEGILNNLHVVGSLDIIFNPSGLVKRVQAGLRDLITLPLEGFQVGPHGFLLGLGMGGVSLVRHMSYWTLSSIAGFSSSLARMLERTCAVGTRRRPSPRALSESSQETVKRRELAITPAKGVVQRGRRSLLGASKGLVGAIAIRVSGALQLVAYTSQGLLGSASEPIPRSLSRGSLVLAGETSEQQSRRQKRRRLAPLFRRHTSRSSLWRFKRHILAGTSERYLSHLEVVTAVLTKSDQNQPFRLHRPVLLLSHVAVHVLENGGVIHVARFPLRDVEMSEDSASHTVTLVRKEGEKLTDPASHLPGDLSRVKETTKLCIKFEENAWLAWLPKLRRAVAGHRSN